MKYLKEMDDWATSNRLGDHELPKKKSKGYLRSSGDPVTTHLVNFIDEYNRVFVELPVGGDIFDEIDLLCDTHHITTGDILAIIEIGERGDYEVLGLSILQNFYLGCAGTSSKDIFR